MHLILSLSLNFTLQDEKEKGLCLSTAVLESDLLTPTSDRLDITTPPRVSKIHNIRLLNPASYGQDDGQQDLVLQ